MNMNLDLSFLADQPSFVNGERANSPATSSMAHFEVRVEYVAKTSVP